MMDILMSSSITKMFLKWLEEIRNLFLEMRYKLL